jgi:enoyl-CoA hydratase/carnithine racemase
VSLHRERHGATLLLTLDRPKARNAIDPATAAALDAALTDAERDRAMRAIVLTGRGSVFVAGGDLKLIRDRPAAETLRLSHGMRRLLHRFERSPLPIFAAINGHAYGGGCEILAACDVRVACEAARFAFRQGAMGLTTGWGALGRLKGQVPRGHLLRLLFTAEPIAAAEALRIGLVEEIRPTQEETLSRTLQLAEEVAATAPGSVAAFKELVRLHYRDEPEADRLEREIFDARWGRAAHREALAAFFGKRPPEWPEEG